MLTFVKLNYPPFQIPFQYTPIPLTGRLGLISNKHTQEEIKKGTCLCFHTGRSSNTFSINRPGTEHAVNMALKSLNTLINSATVMEFYYILYPYSELDSCLEQSFSTFFTSWRTCRITKSPVLSLPFFNEKLVMVVFNLSSTIESK